MIIQWSCIDVIVWLKVKQETELTNKCCEKRNLKSEIKSLERTIRFESYIIINYHY